MKAIHLWLKETITVKGNENFGDHIIVSNTVISDRYINKNRSFDNVGRISFDSTDDLNLVSLDGRLYHGFFVITMEINDEKKHRFDFWIPKDNIKNMEVIYR